MIDVLVVAAFHPELASLRLILGDGLRGRIGTLEVAAKAVGIGLPAAAVGATARIGELRPRGVVLIGTCGVYPRREAAIRDVVVAERVRLVEPAVEEGRAAFPEPMSVLSEADAAIAASLVAAGGRAGDVATTLAVTTDDALASQVGDSTGCEVEHLEAHAVAAACGAFGVPFAAALGVANVVGSSARQQWRTHHRLAGDAAAEVLVRWLQAGAPGLAR